MKKSNHFIRIKTDAWGELQKYLYTKDISHRIISSDFNYTIIVRVTVDKEEELMLKLSNHLVGSLNITAIAHKQNTL